MVGDTVVVGGAFAFGLAAGIAINVTISRLRPQAQPTDTASDPAKDETWVLRAPATCPQCGRLLEWRETIGIVSLASGTVRCSQCGRNLGVPKLILELLCGVLWVACLYGFGPTVYAAWAAAYLTLLVGIAVADFRSWTIPHEFTWTGILLGLLIGFQGGLGGLAIVIISALVGPAIFYVVSWMVAKYKGIKVEDAMGGGDYWMIAMIGAFVGWRMVPIAIVLSAFGGVLLYLPIVVRAKLRHEESPKVPFGVFLAVGGAATFVAGSRLVEWYGRVVLGG